jgi:hypothetical protein
LRFFLLSKAAKSGLDSAASEVIRATKALKITAHALFPTLVETAAAGDEEVHVVEETSPAKRRSGVGSTEFKSGTLLFAGLKEQIVLPLPPEGEEDSIMELKDGTLVRIEAIQGQKPDWTLLVRRINWEGKCGFPVSTRQLSSN